MSALADSGIGCRRLTFRRDPKELTTAALKRSYRCTKGTELLCKFSKPPLHLSRRCYTANESSSLLFFQNAAEGTALQSYAAPAACTQPAQPCSTCCMHTACTALQHLLHAHRHGPQSTAAQLRDGHIHVLFDKCHSCSVPPSSTPSTAQTAIGIPALT